MYGDSTEIALDDGSQQEAEKAEPEVFGAPPGAKVPAPLQVAAWRPVSKLLPGFCWRCRASVAVAGLPNRFHWNEKRHADNFHASSSLACISAGGFIRTGHV